MISTRSICNIGALLHAVRLIKRGWSDLDVIDQLYDKYACGTRDQYVQVVALAHRGIAAGEYFGRLKPDDALDPSLVPPLPE